MKRITLTPASVSTSEVAALFHKPEILTTWIQPSDIENAKTQSFVKLNMWKAIFLKPMGDLAPNFFSGFNNL